MLFTALRDLQWRRRRFLIALIGAALVFSMSLLLSGLEAAFRAETERWLASTGADLWVVKEGSAGPVTAFSPIEAARADEVALTPGVTAADPFVYVRNTVVRDGKVRDVNVFGVVPGGLGMPEVREGRDLEAPGEIVTNDALGYDLGDTVVLGGQDFTVVGLVNGATLTAGIDNVYVPIDDAQATFLNGFPAATQILVEGDPAELPAGLVGFTPDEAADDVVRPLGDAQRSVGVARLLLWVVAALIIGSLLYLSALERTRDFAVMKAVGADTRSLATGLMLQAVLLSVSAAVLAIAFALLLAPLFPVEVEVPGSAMLWLPVVAVPVGLLASLVALRRAVRVPPAAAFGGP